MLVSIVMPVYNSEKTITRAIESVINQKCRDFELIIVDGNSSDDTLNIIEGFKKQINVIISESDKGYADAFNKGIKVAKGDFILMLAADDLLLPLAIDKFKNSVYPDTDVWCGSVIQKMSYGFRLRKSNPD
jgi:glycosyltransferase involved in cell wall biosynthesis